MNNNIPQPKFSVGEQVILQSKGCPELNGDCVVLEVDTNFDDGIPGYRLTIPCTKDDEGFDILWCQTALRKKHDGSEFTFDQLMSTLKQPCNV